MEKKRDAYSVMVTKPEGKIHLVDKETDYRRTLIWILKRWDERVFNGYFKSEQW